MKPLIRTTLVSVALMAGPALSQTTPAPDPAPAPDAAPAVPAAPAETMPAPSTFTPPEGYVLKPDWSGVTAEHLKGADIAGVDGSTIGEISDVGLGADGAVTSVIVDVGGFLGMGVHTVSLGADQISLYADADGKIIAYSPLTKEALEALPEYTPPG